MSLLITLIKTIMAGDQWKDAIRRNYSFFKNNIADPLDVVEYLYGETDPPILNENLKDQIKVDIRHSIATIVREYVLLDSPNLNIPLNII